VLHHHYGIGHQIPVDTGLLNQDGIGIQTLDSSVTRILTGIGPLILAGIGPHFLAGIQECIMLHVGHNSLGKSSRDHRWTCTTPAAPQFHIQYFSSEDFDKSSWHGRRPLPSGIVDFCWCKGAF
jgi:hypothetical protein